MKVSLRSLFCAVGMLLAGINGASAEEVRLDPNYEVFQTSAAKEIVFTNHDCSAANLGGDCEQKTCTPPHVGRDFFVCKDRCAGIIAGTETVFLKPFASGGLFGATGDGGAQMNYNPSQRYWIGYQSADGLGARIRYWEFDRGATGGGGTALGVEFRNLDVEMTQAVDFKRWNLLFSGGLRYQETGANASVAGVNVINTGFDGTGVTFSGQATRDLNPSGSLRMTMGSRWSAVYGNSKGTGLVGGVQTPFINRDDLVNVLEINIGPQYRRRLNNGAYLTLGAGVEAQYYTNGLYAGAGVVPTVYDANQTAGFVGFGSSIAITR
jgi:hypothetical protein